MRRRCFVWGLLLALVLAQGQARAGDLTPPAPLWIPVEFAPELLQVQAPTPAAPSPPATPPAEPPPAEPPGTSGDENEGGGTTPENINPNMIGDFPGGACGTANFMGINTARIDHPTFFCTQTKISEDNSPIPRDRVYFTYNRFENSDELQLVSAQPFFLAERKLFSIDRYTFGLEKTFLDGRGSVEVRIPVNHQLGDNIDFNVDANTFSAGKDTDLGNVAAALKFLVLDQKPWHLSAGLLVHTPTLPDVVIRDIETRFSAQVRSIDNEYRFRYDSVIVSPFLGLLLDPGKRFFAQGFLQLDYDVSGSFLDVQRVLNGIPQQPESFHLHQQDLLRLDLGLGYWVYRNPEARWLTGLAPVAEVHYTSTLTNAELGMFNRAPGNQIVVGNTANQLNIVDLTLGATAELSGRTTVAVAGVVPLTGGSDKPFDWELNVQVNYRFGPMARRAATYP